MSKSKNNYNSMSVWGLLLVGLSLVLILVSVFRYFTAGISFGREGFQQKERLVLKEGSDVYDDFYVDIYDQLVFNELKNEILKYKTYMVGLNNHKGVQTMSNADLFTIRDDILADLNQFLYLYTFK